MIEFPLSKPIEAHGETIKKLSLREPDGSDLMDHGVPFQVIQRPDGAIENKFDAKAMGELMAALAGVPPSSIRKMTAADFVELMGKVAGFFGQQEAPKKRSKDTSS